MIEQKHNNRKITIVSVVLILFVIILGVSYAFFNYTRTGESNTITTGTIIFDYINGSQMTIENQTPMSEEEAIEGNEHKISFSIKAHNTLKKGMRYNVYAVYGEEDPNRTRLLDQVVSLKYVPTEDGDGFTTVINNHETAKSLNFVNGKALISTGTIKNTEEEITKNYDIYLWVDEEKIFISSTTKRQTLPEGNPSLADTSNGTVTTNRYIKNDNITLEETTLYPAVEEVQEKIIYTTNEYKNSYYSIKILVEATEIKENEELLYFDPNGGTVNTLSKMVKIGDTYNDLPTPTREGYTFLGWNGKNLFNPQKFYEIGKDYSILIDDNDIILKQYPYQENHTKMNVNCKENKIYNFSYNWKIENQSDSSMKTGLRINYSNNTYIGSIGGTYNVYGSVGATGNISMTSEANKTITSISSLGWAYSGQVRLSNIQLEEGNEKSTYEPYYVTNSVNITQKKDHVLTAIWQKNS